MKNTYLPTVKCPCCNNYYVILCSHAEDASEADIANIRFSSKEYIEMKIIEDE